MQRFDNFYENIFHIFLSTNLGSTIQTKYSMMTNYFNFCDLPLGV